MDSRGAVISARSRQGFRSPTRRPREISLGAAADEWKSCSPNIMIDTEHYDRYRWLLVGKVLAVNPA
jgi:hypothetical protein